MTPLILAYDHECPRCRRWTDRIVARDREGLVVPFPLGNPELMRMAPELAGQALEGSLCGVDSGTRRILVGAALLPAVLDRLPGWRLVAPLLRLPGLAGLCIRLARPRRPPSGRGLRRS